MQACVGNMRKMGDDALTPNCNMAIHAFAGHVGALAASCREHMPSLMSILVIVTAAPGCGRPAAMNEKVNHVAHSFQQQSHAFHRP